MTPNPDPIKAMGVSAPVFLVLLAVCWLCMLGTIATWIGKAPVPGRETDRIVSQAYSGGLAVLAWIFLAALLLIASSKKAMPVEAAWLAWFMHPLSLVGALAAIAILFYPGRYWVAAIPAIMPVLIAGYVLYTFFPQVETISRTQAGYALWAVVLVLSMSIVPVAIGFLRPMGSGAIEAKPGPELDRFRDQQRQQYRDEVLNQLRHSDDETKLYELSNLIRPDNPALPEVLDFIRKMPHRQEDAIAMLTSQGSEVLRFIADIDLQPTPELCAAARGYLHEAVRHRQSGFHSGPESFVGMEFEEGIPGIRWIAKNCGCQAELGEMEAYARQQQQDAPQVQKFLAALAEIKDQK
jgi:hypothetical protein